MSISKIKTCSEDDYHCLTLEQQYPETPLGIRHWLDGGSSNVNARSSGNPIRLEFDNEKILLCDDEIEKQVTGQYFQVGGSGQTRGSVGDGSTSVSFTGGLAWGSFHNYRYQFSEPVTLQLRLGSFANQSTYNREKFRFVTACDEFIAGSGSSLASSSTGYPSGTQYHDNNRGGALAIYRDVTRVDYGIDGAINLSCSVTPTLLQYPKWVNRDCYPADVPTCPTTTVTTATVNQNLGTIAQGTSRAAYILPANSYNYVVLPNGGNSFCDITIKRLDTNMNSELRIQSSAGFDGSTTNDYITLLTTTAYGMIVGESVTLHWYADEGYWGIV